MEIISHRGKGFGYPENSLIALSNAIENGFSIELDIRLSKDGTPFIIHDKRIDKILDSKDKLADFSSEEIKKLCYKENKGLKLARLEELLEKFNLLKVDIPNLFVHIQDINEANVVENTLELIEKSRYKEKIYLFAVDEMSLPLIKAVKRLSKEIKVGLHLPENSEYLSEEFFRKADFIWVDETKEDWFSESMVDLAHKLGKKIYAVSPELIDNSIHFGDYLKKRWKDIIKMGFDGICTDFPKEFRGVLSKRR